MTLSKGHLSIFKGHHWSVFLWVFPLGHSLLIKVPPNKPENKTSLFSSWSWPGGHGCCLESLLSAVVAKSGNQGKHRPPSFIPHSSRKCSAMVCLPLSGPLPATSLYNMKQICQQSGQGHNTRAIWQESGCYLQAKQILFSAGYQSIIIPEVSEETWVFSLAWLLFCFCFFFLVTWNY